MAINKVIYNNESLIDITDTTATASKVAEGEVFYTADGSRTVGTKSDYQFIERILTDESESEMEVVYEGRNLSFDGTNYIDTNIAFFSEANINKDFRIYIYDIYGDSSIGSSGNVGERCILGAMYEVSPYPGFIVRANGGGAGAGVIALPKAQTIPFLYISRIAGKHTFSVKTTVERNIGGSASLTVNIGNIDSTTVHNTTLTLGCEKDKNGNPYRFIGGSIGYIRVEMAKD